MCMRIIALENDEAENTTMEDEMNDESKLEYLFWCVAAAPAPTENIDVVAAGTKSDPLSDDDDPANRNGNKSRARQAIKMLIWKQWWMKANYAPSIHQMTVGCWWSLLCPWCILYLPSFCPLLVLGLAALSQAITNRG